MLSMAKVRTTLTIDEDVLRWVKVRAARTGKGDSAVIEEALRRELGLDALDSLWARNDLTDDDATVARRRGAAPHALSRPLSVTRSPRPERAHLADAVASRRARRSARMAGRRLRAHRVAAAP